eukprot:15434596-Alexandrium_andersonii.AAC.1
MEHNKAGTTTHLFNNPRHASGWNNCTPLRACRDPTGAQAVPKTSHAAHLLRLGASIAHTYSKAWPRNWMTSLPTCALSPRHL